MWLGLARYQDGDQSFVDGKLYEVINCDVHCSADDLRAAPYCGSRPDCSCSSILTNQSVDKRECRVRCLCHYALFALISAHYWQLFKSYISLPGCRIVSRSNGVKRHRPVISPINPNSLFYFDNNGKGTRGHSFKLVKLRCMRDSRKLFFK